MPWIKKAVIGTGICMGCVSALGAMFPSVHHAEAAVLVIDKQNIEEAIKTAINTASILTDAQKQLALQILNMNKLDASSLESYLKAQKTDKTNVLSEHDEMLGALEKKSSVSSFWSNELGSAESVLNGNETLYDFYSNSQKRIKALDSTNESAAKAAKNAQTWDENLLGNVSDALNDSNNAEGNLQAVQASNVIQAQQTAALINGNELLAQQTAMQAVNLQRENMERTESLKLEENSKDTMKEWADNISDADRTQ